MRGLSGEEELTGLRTADDGGLAVIEGGLAVIEEESARVDDQRRWKERGIHGILLKENKIIHLPFSSN